jgi:hypothetical protein
MNGRIKAQRVLLIDDATAAALIEARLAAMIGLALSRPNGAAMA